MEVMTFMYTYIHTCIHTYNTYIHVGAQESLTTEPASLNYMWDNVVSWMRSAVEFVGLETTPTPDIESHPKIQSRVSTACTYVLIQIYYNIYVTGLKICHT